MPPIGNERDKRLKYYCPNPNCQTVFSRPKIIKYYVCPTCQTLVDESNLAEHLQNDVASRRRKAPAPGKPKIVEPEPVEFLRIGVLNVEKTTCDQAELEELCVAWTDAETEAGKKVVDLEPVQSTQREITEPFQQRQIATVETEKIPTVQLPQQEMTESPQPQHIETVETEKPSEPEKAPEPSPGCQYGFGYLSHRKSGAGIPETCIECPDSLNCMLSEYHKSGESVKEISKWYI